MKEFFRKYLFFFLGLFGILFIIIFLYIREYFFPIPKKEIDADKVIISNIYPKSKIEEVLILENKDEINELYSILNLRYSNNHACSYDWSITFYKDKKTIDEFAINESCTNYNGRLKKYLEKVVNSNEKYSDIIDFKDDVRVNDYFIKFGKLENADKVDKKTFFSLYDQEKKYAKDKNYFYSEGELIDYIDHETFEELIDVNDSIRGYTGIFLARDKNNCYGENLKIVDMSECEKLTK